LKEDVHIGKGADFDGAGGISIGNGVIFAPDVCIYSRTHNFDSDDLQALPFDNVVLTSKVIIKDYVWVGRGAIILPGSKLSKYTVIGAGSTFKGISDEQDIYVSGKNRLLTKKKAILETSFKLSGIRRFR